MKKNIIYMFILLFCCFFVSFDKADAIAQMQCKYQGEFTNFCGDGAGEDCKVDFVIKLENNKFSLVSAKWTNTLTDANGCRQGDDVDKCIFSSTDTTIKFNGISAIKNNGSGKYVQMLDSDYTIAFVKNNYYSCPSSIAILNHKSEEQNTVFEIYVSDSDFDKKYCVDNEIGNFSCQTSTQFNLIETISRMSSAADNGSKNNINSNANAGGSTTNSSSNEESIKGCPKILLPAFKLVRKILKPIIQIGIPILLIVMGTIDFGKAVASSDDKNIKEAGNKFLKRCIAALAVFFIVTIVSLIMGMFKTSLGEQNEWKKCWDAADD